MPVRFPIAVGRYLAAVPRQFINDEPRAGRTHCALHTNATVVYHNITTNILLTSCVYDTKAHRDDVARLPYFVGKFLPGARLVCRAPNVVDTKVRTKVTTALVEYFGIQHETENKI